jgi:hypothetical protein
LKSRWFKEEKGTKNQGAPCRFGGLIYLYGRKILFMRGFILFAFLICIGVSCLEPPDCIEKRNNLVGITFKSSKDGKTAAQTLDTLYARGSEVTIVPSGTVSQIILPLDYLDDTTFYTLQIADTVYKLTLTYNSKIEFVSDQCGEKFVLSNLKVAEHTFDSVNVISSTPGVDGAAKTLEIFK